MHSLPTAAALTINALCEGYVRRVPGQAVHSDGSVSALPESIALGMRGIDFTVLALPAADYLLLSAVPTTVTP